MIAGNTGNVVCNTSFTNLPDSRVKTEMAEADLGELQQLFDSAGTKWKNLTLTARWSDGHPTTRTSPACCGGAPGLPGQAGRGGSLAGPARAEEQVNMEALRDLADDFNVRDPRMLYRLARQRDLDVTQTMAFEALNTGAGKSAAEGPNDRLQADLIDFSQNTRGKTKYGLAVMNVFTRLQNKNAETVGQATKRATQELVGDDKNFVVTTDLGNEFSTLDRDLPAACTARSALRIATPRPWWTGASRR